MPSGHQGVGSFLLLLASLQPCLNPKGNLHFPSEGITPVAQVATMLGYKCLKCDSLREDTILGIYEGHSQATVHQKSTPGP